MKRTLITAILVFLALPACGGSQPAAEGPTEAEKEALAAEEVKAQEDELLAQDAPLDDGFDEGSEDAASDDAESTADEVTDNQALE